MNAHDMMFLGAHRGAEPGSEPGARDCECRAPALVPMLSLLRGQEPLLQTVHMH